MEKTRIILTANCPDKDYVKGDKGYIDGYWGRDDLPPMAIVVLDNKRIVAARLFHCQALSE